MPKFKFELEAPEAKEVILTGEFNNWNPQGIRLRKKAGKKSNGLFAAEVEIPPGRYEFKYVVDGEWKCDPKAEKVPNPFGTENSVCVIPPKPSDTPQSPRPN